MDQVTGESNAVGRASNSSKRGFVGRALSLEEQILAVIAWLAISGADQTKARSWTFGLNNFNRLAITLS
jgi:hypothetical protein